MSLVYKLILLFFINNLLHSQNLKNDTIYVLLNIDENIVKSNYNKRYNSASFSFLIKEFESKEIRDSIHNIYSKKINTRKNDSLTKINPKNVPSSKLKPKMTIDFFSTEKPVKLKSNKNLHLISLDEFRNNTLEYISKKIFFIVEKEKNEFYIWNVFILPYE